MNSFWNSIWIGVQRLETLEELEIQYSQALAKPERETFYNVSRLASHICLPVFYRFFIAAVCSIETKFYHNFSPQNNGGHVKVIPRLDVSYSNENKLGQQSSPPLF